MYDNRDMEFNPSNPPRFTHPPDEFQGPIIRDFPMPFGYTGTGVMLPNTAYALEFMRLHPDQIIAEPLSNCCYRYSKVSARYELLGPGDEWVECELNVAARKDTYYIHIFKEKNSGEVVNACSEPIPEHKKIKELANTKHPILEDRVQRFEEAGRNLLFARHEKKTYGETEVYKTLKERGWKLLAEVLDEGGFL